MSYAVMIIITFLCSMVMVMVWRKDKQAITEVVCGAHHQEYEKVDIDCYLQEVCEEISVWLDIAMYSGVHCQEQQTHSLQNKRQETQVFAYYISKSE